MAKNVDLLERIIEVTANSVTPEEFKETWGYSIDEHVADMMDHIRELEGKEAPVKEAEVAAKQEQRPAALPAAAAAQSEKAGEPLVIKPLDRPAAEGRIVAKVCGPGKSGRKGLIEVKPEMAELKGVEEMVLADGVRGLMVDVGGLSLGHGLRPGMKGAKGIGPRGPKGGPK